MTQSTTGLVELKPCPFCGGVANVSTYETESLWSHNIVMYTKVGCDQCDVYFNSEPGFEVEAPEQWNTRPTDPTIAELVAALEDARDVIATMADCLSPLVTEALVGDPLANIDHTLTKSRSAP